MLNKIFLGFSILTIFSLISCTSARWTIKDKAAADPLDYEIIERNELLEVSENVTPEDPVLKLNVLSRTKYEYAQKVLVQRNIQDYRLRPGLVALGLTGSALAFYAAHSSILKKDLTVSQSATLNAAGGILALSGLLNMKAMGEPRPTGEERYLRQTGTEIKIDTVDVQGRAQGMASIEIMYEDSVIFEENDREISSGGFEVFLSGELDKLQLRGDSPGAIEISIAFNDSTYQYHYPVETILQPYAVISSQLTELRNSPNINPDNILADLLNGSQVKIQSIEGNQWYQVLYGGISDNYIQQEDADIIWRSSDFSSDGQVVTVPQIPFGDVDVESNIPILRGETDNAVALIVTNENYTGDLTQRNYAHRDGRLIKTYLRTALGYTDDNILEVADASSSNQLYRKLSELRFATNDSTELFVYLSGYGSMERNGDEIQLNFLNVADENDAGSDVSLDLRDFLEQISTLSSSQTIVVGDIDFSHTPSHVTLSSNEEQRIIESHAAELEKGRKPTSFLLGMQLSQASGLYVSAKGEDKKHHIFPYYFAKALQNRHTAMSAIYQYLERNVSYTSRKLHDRSQDPVLRGDIFLDLL